MPMTDTPAGLVMDRLRADGIAAPHGPFTSSGFDAWLSRLAEPQPDLDDAENWENRALFLRVSRGLRHVMLECHRVRRDPLRTRLRPKLPLHQITRLSRHLLGGR